MKLLKDKKKFKNLIIILLSLCIICFGGVACSSLAWFSSPAMQGEKVSGGAITNYFHTGTGTKEDPFVITRPVHYYNLVNLYQKVDDYSDQHFYFQVGYQLDENSEELVVYNCDDDGKVNASVPYSKELNLKCYNGRDEKHPTLLPIGTHDKNFLSVFDGKGITLSGFTVSVPESKNACDIGIFGFIGEGVDVDGNGAIEGDELATVSNVYFKDVLIDLSNVTNDIETNIGATQTHNNFAENHNVAKEDEPANYVAYVGYIAGHVITSSQVENVFINDVTIRGKNPAKTSFGYFGCISTHDGLRVPSIGELIASEFGAGNEAGFGGSMDMTKLYNRIKNVFNNNSYNGTSRQTRYPTTERVDYAQDGTPTVNVTATDTLYRSTKGTAYYWSNPTVGTGTYIGNSSGDYTYLYGLQNTVTTQVSVPIDGSVTIDVSWIKSGDTYLSIHEDKTFYGQTELVDSAMWFIDRGRYCVYLPNGTVNSQPNYTAYFLNADTDNYSIKLESTPLQNSTVWTVEDGTFTTTINNTTYYLVYNNGSWILTTDIDYKTIGDGLGHFLTLGNNRAITNGDANNSVRWQVKNTSGNNYNISVLVGATRYYLDNNNGLFMNTSSATWLADNNSYYINSGSDRLYLVYDDGWKAQSYSKHKLSMGSHYLSVNNYGQLSDTDSSSAVEWEVKYSDGGYTISTLQNNVRYYLVYSNPLGVTVSEDSFTWKKDGDSYYYQENDVNYYLQYIDNNGWFALPQTYYTISDENLYMTATGVNTFGTTESANSATRFYSMGNNLSGNIMYIAGGQVCYLGASGNALTNDSATIWENKNNNGDLNAQGTTKYLNYTAGNGWHLAEPQTVTTTYYTIQENNWDRFITASVNGNGVGSLSASTTDTEWVFSTTGNNPSGTIYYKHTNGDKYYLCLNNNTLSLIKTDSPTTWNNNNGKLYNGTRYINVTRSGYSWNRTYTLGTANNDGSTFTFSGTQRTETTIPTVTIDSDTASPTISHDVTYPVNTPEINVSEPINDTNIFAVGKFEQAQVLTGGYITLGVRRSTYVPIRVNLDDDDYNSETNTTDYGVSSKNTGYIIGGTYSPAGGSGQGDIRVSGYAMSNVNGSFNNTSDTITNIYTCNDTVANNGKVNITSTLRTNEPDLMSTFQTLLANSGSMVYGLHFMESQISKDKIIQAETATILGKTYVNYELPESCIDFNVVQRGSIKFFAGDYFSSNSTVNNSFFSLHEIFRDSKTQKILDIKEIKYVYAHSDGITKKYVYQYTDGSFSDEELNSDALLTANGYSKAFDTAWITAPRAVTTKGNSIYYFEIPCNKGEYALGSVDTKVGAYLLYLDIATNGGKVIETVVSGDGSGLTDHNFLVDVRPTGAIFNDTDYTRSMMQFSVDAPEVADMNNFYIKVSFTSEVDELEGKEDFPKGLYTLEIVNKTGATINLDVFLCDNDELPNNEYPYAYEIIYTNDSGTKKLENGSYTYFKQCKTHEIPATG